MSAPPIVIRWRKGDDPARLLDLEWLVGNGLGGFASSSVLGVSTRRYHGLFVPNLARPKGRYIMISRIDEELVSAEHSVQLGGAEFIDGRVDTETHLYLKEFRLEGSIPTWVFEIGAHLIEKTIVMPQHQNTVCVQYRLLQGDSNQIKLRPFIAFRRQDAALNRGSEWPFVLSIAHGRHEIQMPDTPLSLRFGLRPDCGAFVTEERDSRDVLYRIERARGYDHTENLYSPGYLVADLQRDEPLAFVATTQGWETLNIDGPIALQAERHRTERLLAVAPQAAREDFPAQLVLAADQFIVLPGSRLEEAVVATASGDEVRTVIAGYPWFGDWGRDTMISLEGLTLCTGRHREASAILRTFSHYVKDGLLPNLFPEGERQALYHTADATLWYFHAIDRHRQVVGDEEFLRELYPVLKSIIEHHVNGTHFGIAVDARDGLIHAAAPGYALTWMDAKVDGWVVTPRRGKPVEIQALWYNALCLMAEWSELLREPGQEYWSRAEQARASFNARYWNEAGRCLFDVVDSENGDDSSFRPNQIFALSLHHPVLAEARWRSVVDRVQEQLLTPFGLRTLSPEHPHYQRSYHGDLHTRDAAYHQGTVWPWLIGHFVDAHMRVHRDPRLARTLLQRFPGHLREAGIGSISEIFDAEQPYFARGCIAQAWSVAEVLRAWLATAHTAPDSQHGVGAPLQGSPDSMPRQPDAAT